MQPKESLVGFGSKRCAMNPPSLDHYTVSLDIKLRGLQSSCLIRILNLLLVTLWTKVQNFLSCKSA